jgi:hypothetical protein
MPTRFSSYRVETPQLESPRLWAPPQIPNGGCAWKPEARTFEARTFPSCLLRIPFAFPVRMRQKYAPAVAPAAPYDVFRRSLPPRRSVSRRSPLPRVLTPEAGGVVRREATRTAAFLRCAFLRSTDISTLDSSAKSTRRRLCAHPPDRISCAPARIPATKRGPSRIFDVLRAAEFGARKKSGPRPRVGAALLDRCRRMEQSCSIASNDPGSY